MKSFILTILVTSAVNAPPALTQTAQTAPPALTQRAVTQLLGKQSDICGAGTFLMSLGSQPLGRETFEIKCAGEAK